MVRGLYKALRSRLAALAEAALILGDDMADKKRERENYPVWVCQGCAEAAGGRQPKGHMATWHFDRCDVCDTIQPVTQPRDFGYPRFKTFKE